MPQFLVAFIVIVFLLFALSILAKMFGWFRRGKLPYARQDALLTPAEAAFHAVLEQAVGDRYRIMAKVRLADLIKVAGAGDKQAHQRAHNKISGKHLDFVLCQPDTFAIVCAIKLDDASHRRSDRMDRDDFVNAALANAGLPLLRIKARASYDTAALQKAVADLLTPPASASPTASALPANTDTEAPACPACGATMLLRTARKGARTGETFWGCPGYPTCRGTLPCQN